MTLAMNGYTSQKVTVNGAEVNIKIRLDHQNLADVVLEAK